MGSLKRKEKKRSAWKRLIINILSFYRYSQGVFLVSTRKSTNMSDIKMDFLYPRTTLKNSVVIQFETGLSIQD